MVCSNGKLTTIGGSLKQLASYLATFLIFAVSLVSLSGCQEPQVSKLQQIKNSGVLRIATRNSPTTYYVEKDGAAGIEYELATAFAKSIGVEPVFVAEENIGGIFTALETGRADIAAAGLTATDDRKTNFLFGPAYQEVTAKLVFKQGKEWPRHFGQLDGHLKVIAGSSHARMLLEAKPEFPKLSWQETEEHSPEELLQMVLDESIDYTITDSIELNLNRRYNTELAIGFTIGQPQHLAWALAKTGDYSLLHEVVKFFGEQQQTGKIAQLVDQYYGHVNDFDYVGAKTFMKAAQTELPELKPMFQKAAQNDLDWRLLAAMGYQESHWDPKAKSHTGVRGVMMLTLDTARQLGIESRIDAEQSIRGGAEYFDIMRNRIPDRIGEPDRTWLALAAYNIGWGHLEDARIITERQGADPDKWVDVKERLPLLRQKKYYKQTKYGYARGDEPVQYVTNIRRYYDVLVWLDEERPGNVELLDAGEMIADNSPAKSARQSEGSTPIIASEKINSIVD